MIPGKGAVIFDFDGVLADTGETAFYIATQVAKRKNVPVLSIEYLRSHTSQEVLRHFQVRWWELPYYTYITRKWIKENKREAKMFPWSGKMLQVAREQFKNTWIVSSNSPATINQSLKSGGIEFPEERVYGNVGVFGKSSELRKLIQRKKLDPAHVIYVGDEARDIEAARKVGIHALSVGWGYHDQNLLSSHHPTFFAVDIAEFEKILVEFQAKLRAQSAKGPDSNKEA